MAQVKTIEVLGPGCPRCKETFRVMTQVVETEGLPFQVVKNEKMNRMLELGVLARPVVAVDGKVLLSGHIPRAEEAGTLLRQLL